MFAILFCVVQNKFVCKAIHWGFLVLSKDNILAVIIRQIHLVVSYFWWMKTFPRKWILGRHVKFWYRELRRSHITLYKDCDSNLLSCLLFYQIRSV
jgi:hypothetical protein